jgi:transcriptional antiterminator RfaH
MPILPAEPERFPDDLFPGPEVPPADALWWVLHTKPRQEKSLARHLLDWRLPFYLPLLERKSRLRNRVVSSYVPLFPGYVFLLAGREGRLAALTTGRVARPLDVPDQGRLWQDLRQVSRLIDSGLPVTPEQRLGPGSLVEVRSGPLAGLRGKVVRGASGQRFVVQVDFIQQGASVVLDGYCLAPAEPERAAV